MLSSCLPSRSIMIYKWHQNKYFGVMIWENAAVSSALSAKARAVRGDYMVTWHVTSLHTHTHTSHWHTCRGCWLVIMYNSWCATSTHTYSSLTHIGLINWCVYSLFNHPARTWTPTDVMHSLASPLPNTHCKIRSASTHTHTHTGLSIDVI